MSPTPRITHRIGEAIRRQIAEGVLTPGASLPSTRALAEEWGVSRTTVTAAYEQLIAEGYLEARQGARTRVASGLAVSPGGVPAMSDTPSRLSTYGRVLAGFDLPAMPDRPPRVADFRYGDLSSADFPRLAWRKAVNAVLMRQGARLRYGDPRGSPRLREALQGYLRPRLRRGDGTRLTG
ncbi:GntR family transcriptional regulator [Dankookia rubra]|uniref:GntR family transcriptional regulator n=1 Tax=Dankookia rubra TaxID=1442381 RepID=A0A4R5QCB7_9PROT|nr:GntR family transcriptional regulator [Dankookia rubra]TDH60249.1 GntR family transcriptional regulator [Dankookia rubra]